MLERALARELAQLAQRHLDIARAELELIVQIAIVTSVPNLHALAFALIVVLTILVLVLTPLVHAHPFGVVTMDTKGGRAVRTNPFIAAGVPALLLTQSLEQRPHQL